MKAKPVKIMPFGSVTLSTHKAILISLFCVALLSACAGSPQAEAAPAAKLRVIATTSILGDVVSNIAGKAATLSVLLPPGIDPHSYEPTPQEIAAVAQADLVFANGLGLEIFLERLLQNAANDALLVTVSDGIEPLEPAEGGEAGGDPHVWMDPRNVLVWVDNILAALSQADPANAAAYQANAASYKAALLELDAWIAQQIAGIPVENRKLVGDHLTFSYYARRYGLIQVGAVVPAVSSIAEPSAQEVAALEDAIRTLGVRAIFVGVTVNPSLARRIAADTQIQMVQLYTESLSEPGSPVSTYLDMMRYNTGAIVQALK